MLIAKIKRLSKSFTYASRGLVRVIREEQNMTVHTVMAFLVIFAGFLFNVSSMEWIVLLLSILFVVLMEIINSAVERVTDILKPRIHDYVKEIKDIMAAAVMLASIFSVIIGIIIFLPKILNLFVK